MEVRWRETEGYWLLCTLPPTESQHQTVVFIVPQSIVFINILTSARTGLQVSGLPPAEAAIKNTFAEPFVIVQTCWTSGAGLDHAQMALLSPAVITSL